jgi:hypothetical protein
MLVLNDIESSWLAVAVGIKGETFMESKGDGFAGLKCTGCDNTFQSAPKTRVKCPKCNTMNIVRVDPDNRAKVLVDENKIVQFKSYCDKIYLYRKHERILLQQYEFPAKQYDALRNKNGKYKLDNIWAGFNWLLDKFMKKGDLQELKLIYYQMAIMLHDEEKDPTECLKASSKMSLQEMKNNGVVDTVTVLANSDSCESCRALVDKKYSLQEALDILPVPNSSCTHDLKQGNGFCRCILVPVFNE